MSNTTVYEMITEQIVSQLEAGTAPWRQPWKAGGAPRNIVSGKAYRGINWFLLSATAMSAGYSSPYWMTYKQAAERGGNVRKGEKSTRIVFWKQLKVTDKETGKPTTIPMLRYYSVFNLDQTENVRSRQDAEKAQDNEHTPNTDADAIIRAYVTGTGPALTEKGTAAFYTPDTDTVTLPPRQTFDTPDNFYSTAFHELGHSTGHETRLNRKSGNAFGSHDYGREELIAEMTAAFLSAEANITNTLPLSASYLASWISTIKADVKAVVVAAGAAQRAADLILDRAPAAAATDSDSDTGRAAA